MIKNYLISPNLRKPTPSSFVVFELIFFLAVFLASPSFSVANPPFSGTIFVESDILTAEDPSDYLGVSSSGRGNRTMYDRRVPGWVRLNAYLFEAHFDGMPDVEVQVNPEFDSEAAEDGSPISVTCRMYVKGRSRPVSVTERMSECGRKTIPWQTMPWRMLRHKAYMQAARYAFGLAGIYDQDEANDIVRGKPAPMMRAEVVDPAVVDRLKRKTKALPEPEPEPDPAEEQVWDDVMVEADEKEEVPA
ncbi:MAG: recombinase RecT [Limisphaerales bacterium]